MGLLKKAVIGAGVLTASVATDAAARCVVATSAPDGYQWTENEISSITREVTVNQEGRYDQARGVPWSHDPDNGLFSDGPQPDVLIAKFAKNPTGDEKSPMVGCTDLYNQTVAGAQVGSTVWAGLYCGAGDPAVISTSVTLGSSLAIPGMKCEF